MFCSNVGKYNQVGGVNKTETCFDHLNLEAICIYVGQTETIKHGASKTDKFRIENICLGKYSTDM